MLHDWKAIFCYDDCLFERQIKHEMVMVQLQYNNIMVLKDAWFDHANDFFM